MSERGRDCFGKISVGATEQGNSGRCTWQRGIRFSETVPESRKSCGCADIFAAWELKFREKELTVSESQGVKELKAGNMQIPPDRIVAGTYLCAAAATRGKITISNPPEGEMDAFLEVYGKMGGQYNRRSGKLIADGSGTAFPVPFLETDTYPGFPTDLQSPLMAVLTTIPGKSRIRENIFENRFRIAEELNKMGASVVFRQRGQYTGGTCLRGCTVRARELRGGAALLVAALAAQGETVIEGCSFIYRGYEHICEDLASLGAQIEEDTGTAFYENIKIQKKTEHIG